MYVNITWHIYQCSIILHVCQCYNVCVHYTCMSSSCYNMYVNFYVLFWQTLSLLFKMTNSLNVVVIAEKMIAYLKTTRDEYIKADLVSKITQLAERYPWQQKYSLIYMCTCASLYVWYKLFSCGYWRLWCACLLKGFRKELFIFYFSITKFSLSNLLVVQQFPFSTCYTSEISHRGHV